MADDNSYQANQDVIAGARAIREKPLRGSLSATAITSTRICNTNRARPTMR